MTAFDDTLRRARLMSARFYLIDVRSGEFLSRNAAGKASRFSFDMRSAAVRAARRWRACDRWVAVFDRVEDRLVWAGGVDLPGGAR